MFYSGDSVSQIPSISKTAVHVSLNNTWYAIYDYNGKPNPTIERGQVVKVLKENYLYTFIVDSICGEHGFHGIPVDESIYVDVYKWNPETESFGASPVFIGDPNDLLDVTDEDDDAYLSEGNIILITRHGSHDPALFDDDGMFTDPAGVYFIGQEPSEYMLDNESDEDDEIEITFISVYKLIHFYEKFNNLLSSVIPAYNAILDDGDE